MSPCCSDPTGGYENRVAIGVGCGCACSSAGENMSSRSGHAWDYDRCDRTAGFYEKTDRHACLKVCRRCTRRRALLMTREKLAGRYCTTPACPAKRQLSIDYSVQAERCWLVTAITAIFPASLTEAASSLDRPSPRASPYHGPLSA